MIAPSISERNGDTVTSSTSNKRRQLFDYATAGAVPGGVPEEGRPDDVDGRGNERPRGEEAVDAKVPVGEAHERGQQAGARGAHAHGPPGHGRAVGVAAAGSGLSSTLVCLTYRHFGVHRLFPPWAFFTSAVNLVRAAVLRNPSQDGAGRRVVK